MLHTIKKIENKTSFELNKSYMLDLSAEIKREDEFCLFLFILAIPQRWVLPGIRRSSLYSAVAIHAAQNSVRRAKK